MTRRTVRTIDAFYETGSPFEVEKTRANKIYEASVNLVSQYTGPIALNNLRGVRLPLGDKELPLPKLRLGGAPHSAVLTRRPISVEKGLGVSQNEYLGGLSQTQRTKRGLESKLAVQLDQPNMYQNESLGILSTAHELAHTFDLDHCATPTCIMQPRTAKSIALAETLLTREPFCGDCSEGLELAGYQALAERL